ncbi:hypothetical protein ANO11243_077270 [Dothideomycetidae sp. 11243]|nr:hypothetical protein ANO11243_077270 [fungal sp. No.11243]
MARSGLDTRQAEVSWRVHGDATGPGRTEHNKVRARMVQGRQAGEVVQQQDTQETRRWRSDDSGRWWDGVGTKKAAPPRLPALVLRPWCTSGVCLSACPFPDVPTRSPPSMPATNRICAAGRRLVYRTFINHALCYGRLRACPAQSACLPAFYCASKATI